MKYRINYTKKVEKFLDKHQNLSAKIKETLKIIAQDPTSDELKKFDIIGLTGYKNTYRFKIKKYRVIYQIINEILVITVVDIDSRGDIYKKELKQKLK